MSDERTRFWTLCACGGLMLVSAGASRAAEWLVNPSARMATDYNNNPRLSINGDSSAATVGELSATIRRRTERSEWSLQPRLYSVRDRDDALLDRDDRYLRADFIHVSERAQWSAAVDFAYDTTLTSELELTGFVEDNRRHEGISLTAGPTYTVSERTSVGFQAYWNDNHYADAELTGLVDYDYGAVSVFSNYVFSDRATLSVTARAGELHVPANPLADKQDAFLTLGWRYEAWPLWTLKLSAGPSYAKSDFGTDDGLVFDADIQRRGERWTLSMSGGRSVTSTGRGALSRREQVSVAVSRRLTERLSTSIAVRGGRNEELLTQAAGGGQKLNYSRADLRLSWQLAERWSLAVGAGGNMQKIDSQRQGAENYGASLSIVWNGQAHSL